MRYVRSLLLLAVFICVIAIAAGCSNVENVSTGTDDPRALLPDTQPVTTVFTDSRLPGMKGILESRHLQLFIHDQTAEIAVVDRRSGDVWRSNPEHREDDPLASGTNKDMLSAQTRINFYNSLGQISSVNSQTDSVVYEQFALEPIEQGIRVTYLFGKDERGIDDLPQMLTPARYEELTGQMDDTGKRAMRIGYAPDKETGNYMRLDGALKGLQLQRTLDAFDAIGYTAEDLMMDSEEQGLTFEKPIPRIFSLAIEYVLDEDSLLVRVPTDRIHYPAEYPLNNITLLNFFGAGSTEERGSLFVPDGSGALIHFNNGKAQYPSYRQDVYGRDLAIQYGGLLSRDQSVRLPVFGILRENSSFLGIIEQGASVAAIHADVSGRLNGYNYVYPSFYFRNKDDVTLNAGSQQRSLPKFQEQPMKTDYAVRYVFFDRDEASYVAMANYYRQYLVDRAQLPEQADDSDANIPFYLELIGSIEKQQHFLGVPYRAQEPLTTFDQAEKIVKELQERNIHDIRLKMTGWFNGGMNHSLPKKIKVNRSIGGTKGLSRLQDFAQEQGIGLYHDVSILKLANTKGFSTSKDASRRLTETPAFVYPFDPATRRPSRQRDPSYVVSPKLVGDVVTSMAKELNRLKISNISLRDLADLLNSDFRKYAEIDRSQSELISVEALQTLRASGMTIMADGGNAYALPYITDITNAPLSNSKFKLEDESIPFYQIVIRGHIDYTGEPYNLSTFTNPRQYILKNLEFGSGVYFTWMHEPNYKVKDTDHSDLYAVNYAEWIDLAEEVYQVMNNAMQHAHGQPIIGHDRLAEGVYKTTYGNGFYVIVNYNQTSVTVAGQTIEAESFVTGGERS